MLDDEKKKKKKFLLRSMKNDAVILTIVGLTSVILDSLSQLFVVIKIYNSLIK